jgi:hypothetical protein
VFLLGSVVLLLFAPYLFRPDQLIWPKSGLGSDVVHLYWVEHRILSRSAAGGYFPLWDDLIVVGRPILGEISLSEPYPFVFLYPLLRPTVAFALVNALHVFLAGTFAYFLIRALFPVARFSASIGALAFMLMPYAIAHLAGGHLVNVCGFTWMPAILLAVRVSVKRRRLWPAALGGAALALQLMTHPQFPLGTFYLSLGMCSWQCWRALNRADWRSPEFLRTVGWCVVAGLFLGGVTIAVGAVWFLSTVELLPWIATIEFDTSIPFWYQIPPAMLLSLFAPTEFQFPEWTIYVGTVPLFLALVALLGRRRKEAIFLWGAVFLALLVALGDATPLYTLARWLVPGLGYFRTRTRLWAFGGLVVALLAGVGADSLRSSKAWACANRNRRWLNLAGAAYLVVGTIAIFGLGIITRRLPVEVLQAAGAGALSFGILWLWRRRPAGPLKYQAALLVVLLLDLFPLAADFMMAIDPRETFLKPDAIVEFLDSKSGDYRVYSTHHSLSYALLAERGIESIDGFLNLQLAHATEIVKVASGCRLSGYTGGVPPCLSGEIDLGAYRSAVPDPAVLGLLNVRYVVADLPLDVPGLDPVLIEGEVTLYENRQFLPRTFLVERVGEMPAGVDIFEQLTAIDVAHVALVEPEALPAPLPGGPVEGDVMIESRRPGRMTLAVQSSRRALLLYSQAWATGWRATVNGVSAQVVRVDGALLGVVVPAGDSHVVFDYSPLGWRIGWPISLASIVILVIWGGIGYAWPRRSALARCRSGRILMRGRGEPLDEEGEDALGYQ